MRLPVEQPLSRLAKVPKSKMVVVAGREEHARLIRIVVDTTDALPVRVLLRSARGSGTLL